RRAARRARARAARSRGPLGGGLRRPSRDRVALAPAHDRPPATHRDGLDGDADPLAPRARRERPQLAHRPRYGARHPAVHRAAPRRLLRISMALFDLPLDQLRTYRPEPSTPADFSEFWDSTLAAAREHEVLRAVEQVHGALRLVDTSGVTFAGFDGHPIRAGFSRPAGVTAPLPAVVEYLGYGRGRGLPGERLTFPVAGYAHLL